MVSRRAGVSLAATTVAAGLISLGTASGASGQQPATRPVVTATPDPQTIMVIVPPHGGGGVQPLKVSRSASAKPSANTSVKGIDTGRNPHGGGTVPFTGADVLLLLAIAGTFLLLGAMLLRLRTRTGRILTRVVGALGLVAISAEVGSITFHPPTRSYQASSLATAADAAPGPWPGGSSSGISVFDLQGRALSSGTSVPAGATVEVRAGGFVPGEAVAVGRDTVRADAHGSVVHRIVVRAEDPQVVLRGSTLTAAWSFTVAS